VKITGIHVDGYGTLAGLDLDGLAPDLSVIYGLNEAGKSTLLDFVRAALFGFPDRRSRQNLREPLRGGRHGGTLRLLDEDGRPWILERHFDVREPVLTGPDGRRGGDAELRELLGGANAGLFRSIFAFGIEELASLESLDDNDVRDLVFTAGVLGAGRSATRAMRELEARQAGIVRQRSPEARANQLHHRLAEVESRLRASRGATEAYASAQAEYRRLGAMSGAARSHLEELRRRDTELDRLQRCWPMWNRACDAQAKLAALTPPDEAEGMLVGRASEIRSLDAERSAYALRLTSLGKLQLQLEGIERDSQTQLAERSRLEQSRGPAAGDGPVTGRGTPQPPRSEAELRAADQTLQLLRSLIGQRDQLLTSQREQAALDRLARRRTSQAARPKTAVALVTTAFAATVAVAVAEFAGHHATLGAVSVLAALALGATAALLAAGSGAARPPASPGSDGETVASVDPQRLATEIGRAATELGLAATPVLPEVDAVASRLAGEREDRRHADEIDHALSQIDAELAKLAEAHRRVLRAVESESASIGSFEDAVWQLASACGLDAAGEATDVCARLVSALGAAENAAAARRNLLAAIDEANADLTQAAGLGPDAERLRAELSTGELAAWGAESAATKDQVAAAESEYEKSRDDERGMEQELERLRSSDEVASLELERAALATQLDDALEQWTVLGLARALLEATFARYEREKQPAVIARASELFADVTTGRYVRLVAHEDDRAAHHGIEAISARDERIDSGSLSRGTAELLYLCLRLGLAAAHAERTVRLPFVLDDVLVNFDPGRAVVVARAIATLARSHQVLAFTCHPHVVEAFQRAAPECALIELPLDIATGPRPGS
jgi:uncharacterized protein YhaN